MTERKPIPNNDGYYADRKGRIWRKHKNNWIEVNPVTHAVGYQYTNINRKKQLTQRLVCAAFKGECIFELPVCIRKAKNQQPRRLRSQRYLKWGTHGDIGKRVKYCHLTRSQQLQVIRLYKAGKTQIFIAAKFGVSQPAISCLVTGKTKIRNE